jgi:hypothetical protein
MDSTEAKQLDLTTMMSKVEGEVLNVDDLKLAEMGYKPVSLWGKMVLMIGNDTRVLDDVCYGIGV